jgi:hypothetical protein
MPASESNIQPPKIIPFLAAFSSVAELELTGRNTLLLLLHVFESHKYIVFPSVHTVIINNVEELSSEQIDSKATQMLSWNSLIHKILTVFNSRAP